MKRLLAVLLSIGLALPAFAENGGQPASIGQSGSHVLGYTNEGATPVASPNGHEAVQSSNRYGDRFTVIRSGSQTPIPVAQQPTAEMTPAAMITVIPTAIPTAYGTPQFANAAALRSITVRNGFDQDVWCAYGGSTTTHFAVPASSSMTENFGARGEVLSGPIGCIRPASTPASGTLQIWGSK